MLPRPTRTEQNQHRPDSRGLTATQFIPLRTVEDAAVPITRVVANQGLPETNRPEQSKSELAASGHAGPHLEHHAAPTASGAALRFFGVVASTFSAVNRPQRGRQSHRPTWVPAA